MTVSNELYQIVPPRGVPPWFSDFVTTLNQKLVAISLRIAALEARVTALEKKVK